MQREISATEAWVWAISGSCTPLTPRFLKQTGSYCRGIWTQPAIGKDRARERRWCCNACLWAKTATDFSSLSIRSFQGLLEVQTQKATGINWRQFLCYCKYPRSGISSRSFCRLLNIWPKTSPCFLIACSASKWYKDLKQNTFWTKYYRMAWTCLPRIHRALFFL